MAKVRNIFGNVVLQDGQVGVEIECEGKGLDFRLPDEWASHNDGSLRGEYPDRSNEFVLTRPLGVYEAEDAVSELYRLFKENGSELVPSFRTSVHIHRNVQDLDQVQVLNIIYLYYLFEEVLVRYCGKERENNRFCLRLRDADEIAAIANDLFFNGLASLKNYREDQLRYSALNLAAIQKYGSIEFRSMSWVDGPAPILVWMRMIDQIMQYATKKGLTPVKIRQRLLEVGNEAFGEEVFDEYFNYLVNDNYNRSVDMAHSLTIDFPFTFQRGVFINKPRKATQPKSELQDILDGLARQRVPVQRNPRIQRFAPEPVRWEDLANVPVEF